MLLTLRTTNTHGNARSTADAVITALTPAAWYRNATGVTSAGGFASQWDDYSGNTRHLVQATGTNQPAYAAGVFTFDSVDNYMQAASWSQTQPETVVLVCTPITWFNADTFFDGTASNAGRAYQAGSTPEFYFHSGGGIGPNANLALGSKAILCVEFNGASGFSRVNNTAKVTGNSGANNMGGFTLGCIGALGNYGNFSAEEAIVFPSALSDSNLSAVVTALANALTVSV